jgi:hypothetical protein
MLFGGVTYESVKGRQYEKAHGQYFYWSSIRLSSGPLRQQPQAATPCKDGEVGCASWDPVVEWVDPGLLPRILMLSAYPAFVLGMWWVRALGHHGASEIRGFIILMPLLIGAWYYTIGWLIDRWKYKRSGSA